MKLTKGGLVSDRFARSPGRCTMRYLLATILSAVMILGSHSVAFAQKGKGGGHGGGGKGNPGVKQAGYYGHPGGYYGGYPGGYYPNGGYYGHGGYYGNYWYPGVGFYIGLPLWFNYPWGYSRYDYGVGAPYYSGT